MPNISVVTSFSLLPALLSLGLAVVSFWLLRVLMRLVDIWTGAARLYWRMVTALSVGVGLWSVSFFGLLSIGGIEPTRIDMRWQGLVYLCTAAAAVLAVRREPHPAKTAAQVLLVGLALTGGLAASVLSVQGAGYRVGAALPILLLALLLVGGIIAAMRAAPGVLDGGPPRWTEAPSLLLGAGHVLLIQGSLRFGLVLSEPGEAASAWMGGPTGPLILGSAIILLLTALMVTADERNRAFTFSVSEQSLDALITIGSDGHLIYLSPPAEAVVRMPRAQLIGKKAWDVFPPALTAALRGPVEARASGAGSGTGEIHDEESGRWYEVAVHPWPDYVAVVLRDVTSRHILEEQIRYQALHDPLTGLANRAAFQQRLAEMHAAALAGTEPPSMLMLDLDGFKLINDTWGHPVGDQVLIAFARRLHAIVPDDELIARLGGDEVAILLSRGGMPGAVAVAEQIIAAMHEPLLVDGQAIAAQVSIGITTAAPGTTPEDLMRHADRALYQAKAQGKGRYTIGRCDEVSVLEQR